MAVTYGNVTLYNQYDVEGAEGMAPINMAKTKILPIKVKNINTGDVREYNLKLQFLRATVRNVRDSIANDEQYNFIAPILKKEILFSLKVESAFTNGARIAINPLYAQRLLVRGGIYNKQYSSTPEFKKIPFADQVTTLEVTKNRYVKYVLMHECYHIFYQHFIRANRKKDPGVISEYDHKVANIAMDMEINRDMEGNFDEFKNCTIDLGGVWYADEKYKNINTGKFFENEVWEEIYDYLISIGFQPKQDSYDLDKQAEGTKQMSPFEKGWRRAIEALNNGDIDPNKVNVEK